MNELFGFSVDKFWARAENSKGIFQSIIKFSWSQKLHSANYFASSNMPPKRKKHTYKGKPRKQIKTILKYTCPNPLRNNSFDSQAGLSQHFLSQSTCFKTQSAYQNTSQHQMVRDILNQKDGITPDKYEIPFFELDDSSSHNILLVEDLNQSFYPSNDL